MKFIEVDILGTNTLINIDTIQQVTPFPDNRSRLWVTYQKEVVIANIPYNELQYVLKKA